MMASTMRFVRAGVVALSGASSAAPSVLPPLPPSAPPPTPDVATAPAQAPCKKPPPFLLHTDLREIIDSQNGIEATTAPELASLELLVREADQRDTDWNRLIELARAIERQDFHTDAGRMRAEFELRERVCKSDPSALGDFATAPATKNEWLVVLRTQVETHRRHFPELSGQAPVSWCALQSMLTQVGECVRDPVMEDPRYQLRRQVGDLLFNALEIEGTIRTLIEQNFLTLDAGKTIPEFPMQAFAEPSSASAYQALNDWCTAIAPIATVVEERALRERATAEAREEFSRQVERALMSTY